MLFSFIFKQMFQFSFFTLNYNKPQGKKATGKTFSLFS